MKIAISGLILMLLCLWRQEPGGGGEFPILKGAYLGQNPPGDEPRLFAPGVVSTGMLTRDVAMMPSGEEFYYSTAVADYSYAVILVTRVVNGQWTRPEVASFCRDPRASYIEPAISPDGRKFYFASNRLLNRPGANEENWDIWVMDRAGVSWGEPRNLGHPISTANGEFFPSVTRDGTLYFTRGDNTAGTNFIYRSRLAGGQYTEPEKLGPQVNSTRAQYNAFVAPDESYLIVPVFGRADSRGGTDYYIIYRDPNDSWSDPVNLGDRINTRQNQEWSPYVSPDGRYFFFMSTRIKSAGISPDGRLTLGSLIRMHNEPEHGNPGIYWVSAGFIEELRPKR